MLQTFVLLNKDNFWKALGPSWRAAWSREWCLHSNEVQQCSGGWQRWPVSRTTACSQHDVLTSDNVPVHGWWRVRVPGLQPCLCWAPEHSSSCQPAASSRAGPHGTRCCWATRPGQERLEPWLLHLVLGLAPAGWEQPGVAARQPLHLGLLTDSCFH